MNKNLPNRTLLFEEMSKSKQKGSPREAGVIHLVLPLIVLLAIGAAFFTLIYFGVIKNPFKNIPFLSKNQQPSVKLKTEYKNPFAKNTQYVNPFGRKNPFVVNR